MRIDLQAATFSGSSSITSTWDEVSSWLDDCEDEWIVRWVVLSWDEDWRIPLELDSGLDWLGEWFSFWEEVDPLSSDFDSKQ